MLVSVYLPTRNRVDRLRIAVASVLAQSYESLELVVVDDGSSDDTADYLAELAAADPRVRYVRNETASGAPASRNRAIELATGEFVTGLDDDDAFHPLRVELFVQAWRDYARVGPPPSCLYSQEEWRIGDEHRLFTGKRGAVDQWVMLSGNEVGNQIFAPRSHFLEAGLFDTSLPAWQDLEFFYRVLKRFGPARLVDAPTYIFDVTPREDRISAKRQKVKEAYAKFSAAHLAGEPRGQQRLMLQMYGHYYGFRPTLAEFAEFIRLGLWPSGLVRLARAGR